MVFFDSMGKCLHTLPDIVSHSPIVEVLGKVAGMVSHGVSVIGPVIDAVIPATQAIFSNDRPSVLTNAGEFNPQQQQILNLDRKPNEILQDIREIRDGLDAVEKAIRDLKSQADGTENAAKEDAKRILDQIDASRYLDHKKRLDASINWLENQSQNKLQSASASDRELLMSLLGVAGSGMSLKTIAEDVRATLHGIWTDLDSVALYPTTPPQCIIDLYLLGAQWILMYDKAYVQSEFVFNLVLLTTYHIKSIIIRGFLAKNESSFGAWTSYLENLIQLDGEIKDLRYDASIAIMNLNSIVNRLAGLDGSYASRKAMITVASKGETPLLMFIKDDWPELGLGGINSSNLKSKIGAKDLEVSSEDYKQSPSYLFYVEATIQALDYHLRPTKATIAFLKQCLNEWHSCIPVRPLTSETFLTIGNDGKPQEGERLVIHVVGIALPKATSTTGSNMYEGMEIRYTVTYSTSLGESPPAPYGDRLPIMQSDGTVSLIVKPVQFNCDPLSGLPHKIERMPTPSNLGVLRRVYVRYKKDAVIHTKFLGTLEAGVENCTHDLETDKLVF